MHTQVWSFSSQNNKYADFIWYKPRKEDKEMVKKLNKIIFKEKNVEKLTKIGEEAIQALSKAKEEEKKRKYLIQSVLRAIQEQLYKLEIEIFEKKIDTHLDLLDIPTYEMLCKIWEDKLDFFENECEEARYYAYTWKYFNWMSSLAFYVVNEKSNLWFEIDIESSTVWDRYSINDKENRVLKYLWITDLKVTDITTINY